MRYRSRRRSPAAANVQQGGLPELDVSPLIDVSFLLLIFFMCTLNRL